jgi:hypothetical protein
MEERARSSRCGGERDRGGSSRVKRQRYGIQHPITAAANQFLQDVFLEKLQLGAKNSKREKGRHRWERQEQVAVWQG